MASLKKGGVDNGAEDKWREKMQSDLVRKWTKDKIKLKKQNLIQKQEINSCH